MRKLDDRDIRRLRIANHWLAPASTASPRQVVAHLGAMQAQEFWSAEWSIGVRIRGADAGTVEAAIAQAQIVRSWPIRNTLHFTAASDLPPMLELVRTAALKGVERRRAFLGLDEADAYRAIDVLRDALEARGAPVSRDDCLALLSDSGVMTDARHGYHLLWFAALHGAVCMGPQLGATQTFVHLPTWVGQPAHVADHDETLADLVWRYIDSHGPVPAKELRRWTGLNASTVKHGIALGNDRIQEVPTVHGPMLMSAQSAQNIGSGPVEIADEAQTILLLGGFDEYVLGYGDRSSMIDPDKFTQLVPGKNGVFRPAIVDDGFIVGLWRRTQSASGIKISVTPFAKLSKAQRAGIDRAAAQYGTFLGLPATVEMAT